MSITQERLDRIRGKATFSSHLARSIAKNGITPIKDDPGMLKEFLGTKYTLDTGKSTNQASSGRCWIYSALNWMRTSRLKDWGKDFEYSQNYCAFWDKFERANHFLEVMCKLSTEDVNSQEVQNVLTRVFTDGGEWELFENVVLKYGLVPKYAMPETGFSGNSGGYMDILKKRLRVGGGVLHKILREAGTSVDAEVQEECDLIKDQILSEVYRILVCYLGSPPSDFLWLPPKEKKEEEKNKKTEGGEAGAEDKTKKEDAKAKDDATAVSGLTVAEKRPYQTVTPMEFLDKSLFKFGQKVHLSHLPHHPEGRKLVADVVTNMHEGKRLEAHNVSMQEIKTAVRASIKAGQPVAIMCEMRHHDRGKTLLSDDNDRTAEIFEMDADICLSKGDELLYQVTSVAHGMVLIGCDDEPTASTEDEVAAARLSSPLGPLWKVENSWKDLQYLYMTDKWFDMNCYDIGVDMQFVSEAVREQIHRENAAEPIVLPTGDPFCKI